MCTHPLPTFDPDHMRLFAAAKLHAHRLKVRHVFDQLVSLTPFLHLSHKVVRIADVGTGTTNFRSSKCELEQYLSKMNPACVTYTDGLWAMEVTSTSQLGNASITSILACGIQNPIHAEDIIAQSKPTGKCFCDFDGGAL